MCHIFKLLGQLLHGQFGLGLTLHLGKFPQNLAATEGTEHRLTRLQDSKTTSASFFFNAKCLKAAGKSSRAPPHHFPEEGGHLTAVLQDGPDEEGGPGREAALLSVQAVAAQQLTGTLWWGRRHRAKFRQYMNNSSSLPPNMRFFSCEFPQLLLSLVAS